MQADKKFDTPDQNLEQSNVLVTRLTDDDTHEHEALLFDSMKQCKATAP